MKTTTKMAKPLAQFGEKVWLRRVGEDGGSTCASRMTQGVYVGVPDSTALCMTGKGVMGGKS